MVCGLIFLRKTAITASFYFPAEEENVYIRKKLVSVNSTGHDLELFVTLAVIFFMKKTVSLSVWCVCVCVCVFCLFSPFLLILFVLHGKNLVL